MFGHLNNAVDYELFDTAINSWIKVSLDSILIPRPGWSWWPSPGAATSPNSRFRTRWQ